jgi:hypothetical protein
MYPEGLLMARLRPKVEATILAEADLPKAQGISVPDPLRTFKPPTAYTE